MATIELVEELTLILNEDDIKCESLHQNEDNKTCSLEVTHIVSTRCSQPGVRICQKAAVAIMGRLNSQMITCNVCLRPAETCWSLRPI